MPQTLKGRTVAAGFARAPALVGQNPFMLAYGIDPQTGRVIDQRHDLYGQSVRGRVLLFPHGKGPTSGSMWLLETIRRGNGPAAILNRESDANVSTGLILSELLYRKKIPSLDRLRPDAFDVIRTGDVVEVDAARGHVRVWPRSRK